MDICILLQSATLLRENLQVEQTWAKIPHEFSLGRGIRNCCSGKLLSVLAAAIVAAALSIILSVRYVLNDTLLIIDFTKFKFTQKKCFFTVVRILSLNCSNQLEVFEIKVECILYAPTILTQQKLNIISNLSKSLRVVNVELVGGINYTYIPRVSSNNC